MAEWIECFLNKRTERWPEALCLKFAQNFAWGVFYFRDGDATKEQFLKACRNLSTDIEKRKWHLEIRKEELVHYPYYYLCVAADVDMEVDGGDFLDRARACPSGKGLGRCTTGVVQSSSVEIKEPPKTDIIELPSACRFKIYVVSQRLKSALESIKATGVEFLPCRGNGEGFFQLRITGETLAPPDVGKIEILTRCPSCGILRAFYAECSRFSAGALAPLDFQSCKSIRSGSNMYQALRYGDIISSRVQILLASGEFIGRRRCSDGPPIEFGVVEIEGAPWLRRGKQ